MSFTSENNQEWEFVFLRRNCGAFRYFLFIFARFELLRTTVFVSLLHFLCLFRLSNIRFSFFRLLFFSFSLLGFCFSFIVLSVLLSMEYQHLQTGRPLALWIPVRWTTMNFVLTDARKLNSILPPAARMWDGCLRDSVMSAEDWNENLFSDTKWQF